MKVVLSDTSTDWYETLNIGEYSGSALEVMEVTKDRYGEVDSVTIYFTELASAGFELSQNHIPSYAFSLDDGDFEIVSDA